MSGFEKKTCPECGEEVSTHPRWWKEHMATHNVQEPETKGEQEVITEAKVAEPKAKDVESEVPANMKGEERELYLLALRKQEELREAPNVLTNLVAEDEHMELRKLYAPDTIPKMGYDKQGRTVVVEREKRHAFIADGKNLRKYVNRGYVPVPDGHGGFVTTGNGDVLCTLDMETHDAINAAIEKENLKHDAQKKRLIAQRSTTQVRDANGKMSDPLGDFDASNVEVDVQEQRVGWKKE